MENTNSLKEEIKKLRQKLKLKEKQISSWRIRYNKLNKEHKRCLNPHLIPSRSKEAHKLKIEEHNNEIESLNSSVASGSKQLGSNEVSKCLKKLVSVKKDLNNILADVNSLSYEEKRAAFDKQLSSMKAENNSLLNSIKNWKLTTRSFEALEKNLMSFRTDNNLQIQQVRATATKLTTLYKECNALVDQYNMELKFLGNLDFWVKEKNLQEKIINELENEKELLITIISKQNSV